MESIIALLFIAVVSYYFIKRKRSEGKDSQGGGQGPNNPPNPNDVLK